MFYVVHRPMAALSAGVDYLWSLGDTPRHERERIVPSGTLELVINLHEDEFRIYDAETANCTRLAGAIVSGAYRRFFVIDTREHASVIGVHFKPGGALPFFGVPANALANTHTELEALWGRRARWLRERLCAAPTVAERFGILEAALCEHRSHQVRRHAAVPVALRQLSRPGSLVSDVAERLELSHRRLIEVFDAEVGMTPKVYERVQRFQRVWARARGAAAPDWANLALEAGYFDQAHLIREFVAFSGFSPTALLDDRRAEVKVNHVALADPGG